MTEQPPTEGGPDVPAPVEPAEPPATAWSPEPPEPSTAVTADAPEAATTEAAVEPPVAAPEAPVAAAQPPPPPPAPGPEAVLESRGESGGRPEVVVGAAFAGGFLLALILKRLAR